MVGLYHYMHQDGVAGMPLRERPAVRNAIKAIGAGFSFVLERDTVVGFIFFVVGLLALFYAGFAWTFVASIFTPFRARSFLIAYSVTVGVAVIVLQVYMFYKSSGAGKRVDLLGAAYGDKLHKVTRSPLLRHENLNLSNQIIVILFVALFVVMLLLNVLVLDNDSALVQGASLDPGTFGQPPVLEQNIRLVGMLTVFTFGCVSMFRNAFRASDFLFFFRTTYIHKN